MADLNDILSDKPIEEPKPAPAEAPPATEAAPAVEAKDAPKTEPVKADEGTGEKGASPAPAKDGQEGVQQALDAERARRKDWKEKALRLEGELKAIKDREEAAAKAAAAPKPADGQPAEQGIPDNLLDPQGYAEWVAEQAERRMFNYTLNVSESRARATHGAELVDAASAWGKEHFDRHPADYQRWKHEGDPYDVLVKVYQKHLEVTEISQDPAKYRAKIEAEVREKLLAEQAEQGISGQSTPAAAPPPSLATARSAAARSSPGFTGPTPLANIVN